VGRPRRAGRHGPKSCPVAGVNSTLTRLEILDLQQAENHQAYATKLAAFDAAFQSGVQRLSQLALEGKLQLDLEDVVAKQREFVQQSQQILASHQRKVVQAAMAQQRLRDFETQRR
jgi:hypothetical protein